MKTIYRSRPFIGILCLFLVFSLTVTNTAAETKRDAQNFTPSAVVSATVIAFAIAAGGGAVIGGTQYCLERIFAGDDFSGSRLAAHMTVGAATMMANVAMVVFSSGTLNAILGVATQVGVTNYFTDLLDVFYQNLGSTASSAWHVLSPTFKEEINMLQSDMETIIDSTIESLVSFEGENPTFSNSLPCSADFGESITTSNMSISCFGMDYSTYYGAWRMTIPGTSQVETEFYLDSVPSESFMSLIHLTSYNEGSPGDGYSPIDVYVNGTLVLNNYDVAQSHGDHGWHTDNWSIASYLKTGTNKIRIELEDDPWAATHYWVRYISVQEGVVPEIPAPNIYIITASSGSNGSINPEGDVYVDEGDDITFNATPDSGYVVDRWYVDGEQYPGSEGLEQLTLNNIQTDNTFVIVTFKPDSNGSSQIEVSGSTNPDTYELTIAPGNGKWIEIPVRNVGYSSVTVNCSKSGNAANWASLESSSFTLGSQEIKRHKVTINVPGDTSSGTYSVDINYNGILFPVSIRVAASGDNHTEKLESNKVWIDGDSSTQQYDFNNYSYDQFDISGKYHTYAQSYYSLSESQYVNANDYDFYIYVSNLNATGNQDLIVLMNDHVIGTIDVSQVPINVGKGFWFNGKSWNTLKEGQNVITFKLGSYYASDETSLWRIYDNMYISTQSTDSAWAASNNVSIPYNIWNDIKDGYMASARVYATIDQVANEGKVFLFNNGDEVAYRTISNSDVGNREYWTLTKSELNENDNHFVFKGDTSTEPRILLSNIELVIAFNNNDPVLQITKELNSNHVQVGEQVTLTVRIKNTREGSSTGYDTDLLDFLPPGLRLTSGSLNKNNIGKLEYEDIETNTYTMVADEPGRYLLGSARVEYENINGDPFVDESSPVELVVTAGQLLVDSQITPPVVGPGKVNFTATVTDPVTNQPMQDVSVQGVLQKKNGSNWETIQTSPLGWSAASSAFVGVSPEITTAGDYRAYVISQKDLYDEGQSALVNFIFNQTLKVATPSILPNGGTFTSLPTITLSCSTQDTTIRYTIDGSTPTSTSTQYTEALTIISSTYTIRARGFKSGYTDSDTASAIFTITSEEIPELSVIPDSRTVPANSGTTTFTVDNIGNGTMSWTASVISGGNWLSITSGSSGTNSGTITTAFSDNTSVSSRTGTIRVTASGAGGSPKDVTVIQSSSGAIDTDNDGLPDDWENQHFGNLTTADNTTDTDGDGLLDKDEYACETNPNNTDSDGDGDSDGDEVLYGSDPTLIMDTLDSHRPDTPVILQVSGNVPLCGQIFDVYGFGDPDQGDYLSASEWQISTDQNFKQNNIILQRILERRSGAADDAIEHRRLLMPQAVLVKANTYWIRTRHRDSKGLWSLWAVPVAFTTVADNPNDLDNNDIDDACQVPGYTDTNNNGADDSQENIYALYDAEKGNTIGIHADSGVLGSLDAMPSNEIPAELMPEHPMPSGLFSFRIDGLTVDANNPATVDITFYFSEPLPSNTKWYKYDPANYTVSDFTSNLTINGNRAVLTLTDGGPGDDDGVVNGIIVDPSGAAVPSTSEPTTPSNSGGGGGGGGGGGCFIATAAFGSYMEPSVTILRQFRDVYLLPHRLSQLFIETYYRYSPPIADFIAEHNSLRAAVRLGLAPIIGMCWIVLNYGLLFASLIMMLFVTILFGSTVLILRRRKTET